jgi:hypothetical protein
MSTRTQTPKDDTADTQPDLTAILSPEMAEAQKRATAPGWRPTAGDTITGTIVDMAVRKLRPIADKPARNILVLVLDTGDAERYTSVHVMHSVLQAGLDNIRPTKGDRISIAYLGKFQPEDASKDPYHNYVVTAPDAAEVPFNWDRLS